MTDVAVNSRDGVLRGRVPQGWFSATEDSLGSAVTLLLIHDIGGATLTVTPVILDNLALQHIQNHGLMLLARISASVRSREADVTVTESQEFEIRGKKFCGYETTGGVMSSRVVVFSRGGKYYECEVRGGANDKGRENLTRLFTAQQSFLASLAF
ncbi:MAG TPA: hypothetical protein VJ508_11005 [Saprospiraceae bacterium]|nr:hypothetical protein [Saprospiraceae bacterium]